MKIVIIDYGAGNVKSVQFALERLGYEAICSNDAEVIQSADKVIFPGVGEASSAMIEIRGQGLDKLIPSLKQPVLGICLGMQLMCQFSEENNTDCLGIFPVDVLKFNDELKVPQIGWNVINNLKGDLFQGIHEDEYVYYVHSYYVPVNENAIALTDYGLQYAGAIQKDNFYACQFHPEKSSSIGEQILKNFIEL
ncbi:imidazole glycerol phosphate synthase subunit HisH [Urechidicola vernalis]|uniref:Imidazole glycerol phosphate synthase subunit HisH n=1 Tax=Urechidicola vernalis TaxID=3075600 RepID=A0ABU2Y3X1_9FLAO|nr:imidazole glycerol phosphate synthase subunit HisH [Urechidicola sp. P050]MDT0552871.1 imidazole glycerol phosphate synthase subunit HisH [Urechidicola sp. P050]